MQCARFCASSWTLKLCWDPFLIRVLVVRQNGSDLCELVHIWKETSLKLDEHQKDKKCWTSTVAFELIPF